MKEIRFNIDLFEIKAYKDWYKHYFIFLIRYFFNSNNFSWKITKKEFINKWMEYWFTKRNIENIYQKWKINNNYIRKIDKKWKDIYIYIKSIFSKDNLLVYIEKGILERIKDINSFRSLSYIIIASKPLKLESSIKKELYEYKNPSRTITTIWKNFWNTEKSTMSKRLKKAKEIFNDIFNISSRYSYFKGFLVQLSNLYSIKGVRYLKKQDNRVKKEFIDYKNTWKVIKNKFINKKKVKLFWNKPKKNLWFLDWELYKEFWKEIKKETFN